jgi:hypothetical protein
VTAPTSAVPDFAAAAAALDATTSPDDVFGPIPQDGNLADATRRYRRLARLVHPDIAANPASAQGASSGWASCGRTTPLRQAQAAR